MSERVIVWDLETLPDLAAAARMLDMVGAPDEDVRAALGTGFPKHPLHKIACIGASIARRAENGWTIDALGAPTHEPLVSPPPEKSPTTPPVTKPEPEPVR